MRVLAAIGLLAGCAGATGGAVVHSANLEATGVPERARLFASAGPSVEVRGAPPGGADAAAVAAALELPGYFRQRDFVVADPVMQPNRIVLVFGAMAVDPARVCTGAAAGGTPATLKVGGAFCAGDRALSTAVLDAPASGPGDPAFPAAMRHLLNALLPQFDPARMRPFGRDG